MMSRPPMGALAADVYQQLVLLAKQDEQLGWPLAHFIAAKFSPAEEVASWVRDTDGGPGYSIVVDLDRAPVKLLPWLAQFKGVVIPPSLPEDQWRDWARTAEGMRRGSTPALVRAGQRHLTGSKLVRVLERVDGDPYLMTVITRTSETPDPAQTLADFKSAKRRGIVLTHIVSDAPIIDEFTRTIDAITAAIDSLTIADVI